MGRYRCPSCATVVDAPDPTRLVCPACGFGDPSRISQGQQPAQPAYAPAPQPPGYAMPAPTASPYGYSSPAPQPVQYPPGPAPGYYQQPQLTTPGQSVAALVFGIVAIAGFCVSFVPIVGMIVPAASGIAAVVLGSMGIRASNAEPQRVGGKGMAITGLVLGIIGIAWGLVVVMITLFVGAMFDEFLYA